MLHGPVHRQPGHQWYDPLGHVLGVKYPLRAMGSTYVMSGRMAREVVAARGDALRVSHNGTCSPEGAGGRADVQPCRCAAALAYCVPIGTHGLDG